jgi:hypothetical protein
MSLKGMLYQFRILSYSLTGSIILAWGEGIDPEEGRAILQQIGCLHDLTGVADYPAGKYSKDREVALVIPGLRERMETHVN